MRSPFLFAVFIFACGGRTASAQSLLPRAVVSAGGNGALLSWTLGQPSSFTFTDGINYATAGMQQPEGVLLSLNITALLDGPYDAVTDLMYDSLRTRALLPLGEPYTALGHPSVGLQPNSILVPLVLAVSGPDALVDWVFVELRDGGDASRVVAGRAALVQRDGDLVDMDGVSPVRITALSGSYFLAVFHRNHLPVLTQAPLVLGPGPNVLDLTTGGTALHVPEAQVQRNGRFLLWQGDVTGDATVKYTGSGNDRDPVLLMTGGGVPTHTATGYLPADVNMDGTVKYTGARNDRDPILLTVGGTVPTNVRAQPLP